MILGVPSRPGLRIVVASKPVDFRKGMDSLAALVAQALSLDPFLCADRHYVTARPRRGYSRGHTQVCRHIIVRFGRTDAVQPKQA